MRRWTLVALAAALLVAGSSVGASAANQWPATVVAGAGAPDGPLLSARANGVVTNQNRPPTFYSGAYRLQLAQPITGMAITATGKGHWLAAGDGGVFSFGDADFYGSMAAKHLNQPVVGIASTKDERGYWLAAADGGVFTFGNARYLGSMGSRHLDQPIVGISATPSGNGYRLVARDGGVFTFGDATFHGSLGGRGFTDVVGLAPTPSGNGYWIPRRSGATYCLTQYVETPRCGPGPLIYNFGNAQSLPQASFFELDNINSPRPTLDYDYDFVGNPIVAIVTNPVRQGYVILRANGRYPGIAGALPAP